MEEQLDKKLAKLRDQLERGDYVVDPNAVAEAILKRWREMAALRAAIAGGVTPGGPTTPQSECSYPASGSDAASRNRAPARPSATRPIQVRRAVRSAVAKASAIVPRAAGGAQIQSS